MRALILLMMLGLSAPTAAQTSVEALLDRLRPVDPAAVTEAECEAQAARAANLNGPDLLYAASVCQAANRPVEASFLLSAGQVRSAADMVLMVPATRADSDVVTSLYGVIYYYAGGPGADEVLRDPSLRERFLSLFDRWSPAYSADYDPGWNTRRRADSATYQAAISELKSGRRRQLADIARRYSDDAYYTLHRRFHDLQSRNPGGFVEGTADANLSRELMRQMDERATALGVEAHSPDRQAEEFSEARFPPAAPAPDEVILTGSADPVVERCAAIAERLTIAADSRVVRILITRSPEWGTIWRADIAGGDQPAERFTCTERTSSSRPLELGGEAIPPLAEGPSQPQ